LGTQLLLNGYVASVAGSVGTVIDAQFGAGVTVPVIAHVCAVTGDDAAGAAVTVDARPTLSVCAIATGPCSFADVAAATTRPSAFAATEVPRIACDGWLALAGNGEVDVPEPARPVHLTSTCVLALTVAAGNEKQVWS
jgi:hypothetical protein